MANIHTVLDAIIENGTSGRQVQMQVVDKREYETVRTRLVTLWVEHRDILLAVGSDTDPLTELSLCGNFQAASSTATFYLGKPRRKLAKSYSFSISPSVSEAPTAIGRGEDVGAPVLTSEPANDETIVTPKLAE